MGTPEDDAARRLIERYDREAAEYRDLWAPTLRLAGRRLLREFSAGQVTHVLDVATGVGSMLPELRATFPRARVFGVDRSQGMLSLVPPNFPRATMDATRLGIASDHMDVVFLMFCLFHLEDPEEALREARRTLRGGGRVGCITWGSGMESGAETAWNRCLDEYGAPPAEPGAGVGLEAVDAPQKMEALLRAAGFSSIRSWKEGLVDRVSRERMEGLRTSLGASRRRLQGLPPQARASCLEKAMARLAELDDDEFVATGEIVYSIAER